MLKRKLYLSKSNAGSAVDMQKLRQILKTLDVEIIEYSGVGKFDMNLVTSADILLIVPPNKKKTFRSDERYLLGKGQYEQIIAFEKKMIEDEDDYNLDFDDRSSRYILLLHEIGLDAKGIENLIVEEYCGSEVLAIDWQTNYASIEGNDYFEFITDNSFDVDFLPTPCEPFLDDWVFPTGELKARAAALNATPSNGVFWTTEAESLLAKQQEIADLHGVMWGKPSNQAGTIDMLPLKCKRRLRLSCITLF
jgi:hypothetical protein